jgi:hypothetical protein
MKQAQHDASWRVRFYRDVLLPLFLPIFTVLGAVAVVVLLILSLLLLD